LIADSYSVGLGCLILFNKPKAFAVP
jgi:hypothetical protein